MKLNTVLTFFFSFLYCVSFAQDSRNPISISNDFYTIKISDGISPLKGVRVTSEKSGRDYFNIVNMKLKDILERVYPNSSLRFLDNRYRNQLLNVELMFQGMSLEEFQPLFKQQICNFLPIKITEVKKDSEKWTLKLQDSILLSKKIHIDKLMDIGEIISKVNSFVSFSTMGDFKAEKVKLDELAKHLSRQIEIPLENMIESNRIYDFELKITNPVNYEEIKKQLKSFGIQVVTEKNNSKVLEISTTK